MKNGIYQMTDAEYHANPEKIPFLSASIINTLLNQSPLHAWYQHPILNPDYVREEDSKFDVGTAAHSIILEGVDNICELDYPDWRTNASKENAEAARMNGMVPLLKKHAVPVRQMASVAHRSIDNCPELCGITLKDGKPEQTMIWFDEEYEIWCKARIDWLHNDYKLMIDLKSTAASAEPAASTRRVLDGMQAYIQAAFYRRGLKSITGSHAEFIFMCQESKPPFAVSFINTTNAYLAMGDSKISVALPLWKRCLDSGIWPGYEGRIYQPEMKPWVERDWIERLNGEMENVEA